jgi:glutamyl-tRNA synthetase
LLPTDIKKNNLRGYMKPVRVRFAPSPTGHMHLGSARTALYDFLLARQSRGQFVLRIEDTDQKRYVEGAEEELLDGLRWLGLEWDEGPDKGGRFGPYRQSERKEIYQQYARQLVEAGHAYYCFCTPKRLSVVREAQIRNKVQAKYDGTCRNISLDQADMRIAAGEPHVVRFKSPKAGTTTVLDKLRGEIIVDNATLDDYILVKSDGLALYHLAAPVDDHLMEITHVLRGSEWLPTFPLHSLIHQAFGWDEPEWVHLSVFLKPSGKGKMSKREAQDLAKDGKSIFIKDLRELGYLPEAVVNWIALMGWSYDDHTEFFSMQDLIEKFSLEKLNPSPAAINFTKFDHFNGLHIRNLAIPDLTQRLYPFFFEKYPQTTIEKLETVTPIIQERLKTLDDGPDLAGFLFEEEIDFNPQELIAKNTTAEESLNILLTINQIISQLPEGSLIGAEEKLREWTELSGYKPGQVFGILRIAVTGRSISPPLFETMDIIGREKVECRLTDAIALFKKENF